MSVTKLFRQDCEFRIGATKVDHIPDINFSEVAFAGRSNVGKSSLLNALLNRKSLARTSKTPGCTRQLNFFSLGDELMLVDLPGYGYAKTSKKEIAGWNKLLKSYLVGRANLRQVFLLIDSRHDVKDSDEEIMTMLDKSAVSYQIILTKSDKQSQQNINKLIAHINNLAETHTALHPEVLITSSKAHKGLNALRKIMAGLV